MIKKLLTIITILLTSTICFASAPTKPYDFTAGTTIRSSEVDQNFDELYGYTSRGVEVYKDKSIIADDIADDTIGASKLMSDSVGTSELDLTEFTCADFTLSDCGALTSSGLITATGLVVTTSIHNTALSNCNTIDTDGAGNFKCGTDEGGVGSFAPTDADYLVGTADGTLSAEIVVGTSPGGALGGTWASPTVDSDGTWTGHNSYPAACAANSYVSAIGDTVTCGTAISGNAGTATALAANGANCAAGQYPLGVDASGAVEDCTAVSAGSLASTDIDTSAELDAIVKDNTGSGALTFNNAPIITGPTVIADISLEGATDNTNETLIDITDPTGDRTIVLPDASGTFAISATAPATINAATGDIGVTVLKDLVTTAPLTGGTNDILPGADADITIAIPAATTSADGYLSSTNWNTFNGKQNAIGSSSDLQTALKDETGTGVAVFSNAPTVTSLTVGTALTITAGILSDSSVVAADIQNNTFPSSTLATKITDESGTGQVVFTNSPTITSLTVGTALTITEGILTDATIVSADIKDATIAGGDLASNIVVSTSGAVTTTGLVATTSLQLPYSSAFSATSPGTLGIDTTSGQFIYKDTTAQRIMTWHNRKCFGWFDPADADDDIEVWTFQDAVTVTNINCRVSGGTSIAVTGGDGTNAFEAITCDADGATDDGSITNATFTAGETLELDLGAPSGTVPSFIYCVDYTVTGD